MDLHRRNVRQTDFDALSSRYSAVNKNYLQDAYIQQFVDGIKSLPPYKRLYVKYFKNSNKYPVINIGTYLRTYCIDSVIRRFLDSISTHQASKCQIISLGAGSDTRVFNLLNEASSPIAKKITYIELDFPETTTMKASVILKNPDLCHILKIHQSDPQLSSELSPDQLHSKNYHLLPIDLCDISSLQNLCKSYSDPGLPTLIISECVLCYINADATLKILNSFHSHFSNAAISIYEPMSLDDNFGAVMSSNLSNRGLSLPSMNVFKDLKAQYNRLAQSFSHIVDNGISSSAIFANDLYNIYNTWISADEKVRLSRLEFLDELEELFLLLKHYCFIIGCWSSSDSSSTAIQDFLNSLKTLSWEQDLNEA